MTCFLCVSCEKEGFQVIKNIFVTFGDLSFVGPFLLSAQCFFCGGGHVFFRTGAWDPPPYRSWDHLPFLGPPANPELPCHSGDSLPLLVPPPCRSAIPALLGTLCHSWDPCHSWTHRQCWNPLTFLGPPPVLGSTAVPGAPCHSCYACPSRDPTP